MPTLVFLEHHDGELQKGSLGVLSKAASLGDDVTGVLLGSGVARLAAEAGKFGAARVLVADDPALEAPLPQPRVDALAKIVSERGFDTVLFAGSVLAADVAAGLAARLDAGLNWDLTDIASEDGRLVGRRPAAPSQRPAPSSTRAGTRTRRRSARPAAPSRRSSTSPVGSPARSSTRSGCRARTSSSRSTKTRTRRSSSSPTSASSATCTRSSPS